MPPVKYCSPNANTLGTNGIVIKTNALQKHAIVPFQQNASNLEKRRKHYRSLSRFAITYLRNERHKDEQNLQKQRWYNRVFQFCVRLYSLFFRQGGSVLFHLHILYVVKELLHLAVWKFGSIQQSYLNT